MTLLRDGSTEPYGPLRNLQIGRFDPGTRSSVIGFQTHRIGRPTNNEVVGEQLVSWRGIGAGNAFTLRSRNNMR